jgi:hypothetical protein
VSDWQLETKAKPIEYWKAEKEREREDSKTENKKVNLMAILFQLF